MFANHPDTRSPERRALDEQLAQEPVLPPSDLPPHAVGTPLEVLLARIHAPIAASGVVENGVVRLLDPNVRLAERAQVIIVAEQIDAATIESNLHEINCGQTALYWRVCGYLSITWVAMGVLWIAAFAFVQPKIAEPIAPRPLRVAVSLLDSGFMVPLAAIATVPAAIAFLRRSRNRPFRCWFGCYSVLIIALNVLAYALREFVERAGMIPYPDGSFQRYHFTIDETVWSGLVTAMPWFLFVLGECGAWVAQSLQRFRRHVSTEPLVEK